MPTTSILLRLLAPARADGRAATVASIVLFAIGAALASCWTLGTAGSVGLAVVVATLSVIAAACIIPHRFTLLRVVACASLVVVHLFWLFAAAAFAAVLAWSIPAWVWVIDGVLAAIAVASAVAVQPRVRVPTVLPIGFAIAALLGGWMREDGVIRCDDYLHLRSSGVAVLVPSTPELERCRPGESLMVHRYPRQFWEYPGGDRFVVTTQRGDHDYSPPTPRGRLVADWFNGAICRVDVGPNQAPQCFAEGKAHGIADSQPRGRLYVVAHDRKDGTVYAVPREGPFRPLAEAHLPAELGNIFLDESRDLIGVFEDGASRLFRLRASDLVSLDPVPAPFLPDAIHYDQQLHQGIACAATGPLRLIDGQAFAAVAFEGVPFSYRPLAPSSQYPSSWLALTWGCDWDATRRRAYVAVASLGLLEEIDYDTARILRRSFVGLGVRTVTFDSDRRRIYAGFFLSGDVIAIDVDSGAILDRWFAGRFVRYVALSRDQHSLLATSNLGIVSIPLTEPAVHAPEAEPL